MGSPEAGSYRIQYIVARNRRCGGSGCRDEDLGWAGCDVVSMSTPPRPSSPVLLATPNGALSSLGKALMFQRCKPALCAFLASCQRSSTRRSSPFLRFEGRRTPCGCASGISTGLLNLLRVKSPLSLAAQGC